MPTHRRAPSARAAGQRRAAKAAPVLPKAVTDRTDRLVELQDHCDAAKQIAEDMDESLLAFLLSMAIEETRTAMRRATLKAPPPPLNTRSVKPAS